MSDATFACPDLTTFARLDELGLEVTGQRVDPDRVVLACRLVDPDRWCRRCGCQGVPRDTVSRRLAHEPLGWRPTTLLVTVRRYRCSECVHVWRLDTSKAASPRAKLSRRGLRWALEGLVVAHLSMARVAHGLGVSWNTANDAVLAEGHRLLIADSARFDGVEVIGVDEHVWRHTRRGEKYVTVIIDLTGPRAGTGPARLLDMVEGRSKQVFKQWLAARDQAGATGSRWLRWTGSAGSRPPPPKSLDRCRRRIQQLVHGHRGHVGDPLYRARRTLHTGADLLTEKQIARFTALFAGEEHVQVEATSGIYLRMIAAYRQPDRHLGKQLMQQLINATSRGVPSALTEIITLGRTLTKRAADVLAYFDRPGTSNGPTEAINGRLDHLRGTALGFRNLANYIAGSLLETGGFRPQLHPAL